MRSDGGGGAGLGRGVFVRAVLAFLIAMPLFAWWTFAAAPTLVYDPWLGRCAAPIVDASVGGRMLLMSSPDNPGHVGVFPASMFEERSAAPRVWEPLTVVRTDHIRAFVPWLLALAMVWQLLPALPRGGKGVLQQAWRRAALMTCAVVGLFITHVATFVVVVVAARAEGFAALGLAPWDAWSRSAWSTASWFLLLIGGPFFPVLIVAGFARLLRAR